MTLQITLSAELENRLRLEAERHGISPDAVTLKLLNEHLPADGARNPAVEMLNRWLAEDAALTDDEVASNKSVLRAVDADRLSNRRLFGDVA